MKRLIVNGDDFGASHGVNVGMIRAHRDGILTSASMMVHRPGSPEAARLTTAHAALGVGLHVELDPDDGRAARSAVERQLERFVALTNRMPTHLDAHRNLHRDERLRPMFLAAARRHGLPLRGHCGVRHIPSFYGRWDGESHPEQIGCLALARILEREVHHGFNELCCHPGYVDADLDSSYRLERERELQTLCDPRLKRLLAEHGILLTTFGEVAVR
jgi:predicted glycoside hydrolase/deacetylase ChbG (UPF0249 family)